MAEQSRVQLTVPPAEAAAWRTAANAAGIPLATWIRAILRTASRQQNT